MRNLVMGLLGLSAVFGAGYVYADEPKYTIKQVMKEAMKGGLCDKVAKGEGSKEDKEKLVEMFTAMGQNTPPKGDKGDWDKLCAKLVADAKAAQKAEGKSAIKSANCKACHDNFK